MKIAIIGAGISGLAAAERLYAAHELTLYEAEDWIGGHTHTVEVPDGDARVAIDTGFIVYNDWTYPEFIALLERLGVSSQPSDMSFGLYDERAGLAYNGTSLNALFAQRSNLLSPSFIGMLIDILRFNRDAPRSLEAIDPATTLGEFLSRRRYGRAFAERYIVPMGRAIWSAEEEALLQFPAAFFIDFFRRHGLLNVSDRPQWRAISGGSGAYVQALIRPFAARIRTRAPVTAVRRQAAGALVTTRAGGTERYDAVLFGCHADQALGLLEDATRAERDVLGSFGYQHNEVVLHTDERLLPQPRRAQAAWNYRICVPARAACTVTYDMNVLQRLKARRRYLVSLNLGDRIDPAQILGRWSYAHPIYTPRAVEAQGRHAEISGVQNTFYCGAYWRYGFHEDGVVSGLRAATQIGQQEMHAKRAV